MPALGKYYKIIGPLGEATVDEPAGMRNARAWWNKYKQWLSIVLVREVLDLTKLPPESASVIVVIAPKAESVLDNRTLILPRSFLLEVDPEKIEVK